jgi:hypothetical protein
MMGNHKILSSFLAMSIFLIAFLCVPQKIQALTSQMQSIWQADVNQTIKNPIDTSVNTNPVDSITGIVSSNASNSSSLSIDFASSFSFGTQTIDALENDFKAFAQVTTDENATVSGYVPNFIQISDLTGTFVGWTLSVNEDSQFHLIGVTTPEASNTNVGDYLTGATLSFSGGQLATNATDANDNTLIGTNYQPTLVTSSGVISTAQTILINAQMGQGMGIWLYVFGDLSSYDTTGTTDASKQTATQSPIVLTVPGSTIKRSQTYVTNLIWTLAQTP